jgi:hypothetical protein
VFRICGECNVIFHDIIIIIIIIISSSLFDTNSFMFTYLVTFSRHTIANNLSSIAEITYSHQPISLPEVLIFSKP